MPLMNPSNSDRSLWPVIAANYVEKPEKIIIKKDKDLTKDNSQKLKRWWMKLAWVGGKVEHTDRFLWIFK